MGNPSQQGKKTQPNPLLYYSREIPSPPRKHSTQEGAQTLEDYRPREVCTFPNKRYDSSIGNLPLLILDRTCQQKCLLAQQGRPH
jgi:hypothetical protein